MTGKIDQITAILKMIPPHRNDGFSTKDKAQFFQQLHLKIHGDRQREGERQSSLTVQYKAKWKNSRNEISIDCFSSQRFPRDLSPRGGMARIMDRSAKQLPLLSARLSGPGHYLGYHTFQSFLKSTTKTVWLVILIKVYSNWCLPTRSPLPLQPFNVYLSITNHTEDCF